MDGPKSKDKVTSYQFQSNLYKYAFKADLIFRGFFDTFFLPPF